MMTLLLPHLLQQIDIDAGSGDDSITVTTSKLASRTAFGGPVQIRFLLLDRAKLLTKIFKSILY